jgi:hypothetical protein
MSKTRIFKGDFVKCIVRIGNEFMADNDNIIEDPDGSGVFEDWIEIYNSGGSIFFFNFYLNRPFFTPLLTPMP